MILHLLLNIDYLHTYITHNYTIHNNTRFSFLKVTSSVLRS